MFRHNILDGQLIVDAHQWETSVDVGGNQHGARQIECYDNTWTQGGFYDSLDILAGTGFIFNNHFPVDNAEWFNAGEYGAHTGSYAYTPSNLPVADQIGSGQHTQFAGKEPMYVFGNSQTNGADKTLQYFSVSAVSSAAWTNIQHDVNATFGMANMLVRNQDFFEGYLSVPFTGTGATNGDSVGVGSKAVMLTKTPSLTGAGYWVTNEGSWDTTKPANTSGQFYKWNGSSWVLFYTPLTYPHPLALIGGGGNPPPFFTPPSVTATNWQTNWVTVLVVVYKTNVVNQIVLQTNVMTLAKTNVTLTTINGRPTIQINILH